MGKVNNENLITREGYEELERQITELETTQRREIAEQIKQAREFGDISENSEYEEAKNEQAMLEARIAQLKQRKEKAEIVDVKEKKKTSTIEIGSKVTFTDGKKEQNVLIVGHGEADLLNGKLSAASPVGAALLGSKKGEEVKVSVPKGNKKLTVVKVA